MKNIKITPGSLKEGVKPNNIILDEIGQMNVDKKIYYKSDTINMDTLGPLGFVDVSYSNTHSYNKYYIVDDMETVINVSKFTYEPNFSLTLIQDYTDEISVSNDCTFEDVEQIVKLFDKILK